jgi:ATP-dependent DNA helicase DinG
MLEAEVHEQLREFLREATISSWSHHLTMARIVSRALRLKRSALIQTGRSSKRYCLSYLVPALLSHCPILLVAPPEVQQHLLRVEIPRLQEWLATGDTANLILATPQDWLRDCLEARGRFPQGILTLIDGAGDLENYTRELLTAQMLPSDWDTLLQDYPEGAAAIWDLRVRLTKSFFDRPKNPYECYLLAETEQEALSYLLGQLAAASPLPPSLCQFWQRWQTEGQMRWASLAREKGQFILHVAPVQVAAALRPIWQQQTTVFIDGFLDKDKNAAIYRQQLGLGEMLCLKFSPSRQSESIQLYLPERLPLPNTPEFQGVLLEEVRTLLHLCSHVPKAAVVLVEDIPLRARVGTKLAAEFGSRVQVQKESLPDDGILVSGWQFWHAHQGDFPTPQLLIIATLPIPSLEDPLVAERVAYYKRQHQDWFRRYLLPVALGEMPRAVLPLRESQGVVAILDNRVNSRSYGRQILEVLSPYARINYLEPTWFGIIDFSVT